MVLRFDADAASDAKAFQFHPSQTVTENTDGSLTVRFKVSGIEEMCWHRVTWGESLVVLVPVELRQRLAKRARRAQHTMVANNYSSAGNTPVCSS